MSDLIGNANLVITNDSGPLHLSIAHNVPVLCALGGGQFKQFAPYPNNLSSRNTVFVYKDMKCFNCDWHCHYKKGMAEPFKCVNDITLDDATRALDSLLTK